METTERLAAIEDIKQLKARYFRGVDTKDWRLLAEVLASDIVCDYRGSATDPASGTNYAPDATNMILHGSEAVIKGLEFSLHGIASAHHGFCPDIQIVSEDEAKGIWGMHDTLRYPAGRLLKELRGYGYYHEVYVRRAGRWQIARLRIERLRIDFIEA